jgi:hypothetical protein
MENKMQIIGKKSIVKKETWTNYLKIKEKLRRLEAGGVDNWEGYDEAMAPKGEQSFDAFCAEIELENYDVQLCFIK